MSTDPRDDARADYAADHLAQIRRERAAARGPILRPRPVGREASTRHEVDAHHYRR